MKRIFLLVLALAFVFAGCGKTKPAKKPETSVLITPETQSSEAESNSESQIPEETQSSAPEMSTSKQETSTGKPGSSVPAEKTLLDVAKESGFTEENISAMKKEIAYVYAMDYSGFRAVTADSEAGVAAEAALKNNAKSETGFLVIRYSEKGERTADYLYLAANSPKELAAVYKEAAARSAGTARWFAHMNPENATYFSYEKDATKFETSDKSVAKALAVEICFYDFAGGFVSESEGFTKLTADENYYSFRLDFKSGTYYSCQGNAEVFSIYTSDLNKTITYKIGGYKTAESFGKRMEEVSSSLAKGGFEANVVTG